LRKSGLRIGLRAKTRQQRTPRKGTKVRTTTAPLSRTLARPPAIDENYLTLTVAALLCTPFTVITSG
jgi:hypothetical protein